LAHKYNLIRAISANLLISKEAQSVVDIQGVSKVLSVGNFFKFPQSLQEFWQMMFSPRPWALCKNKNFWISLSFRRDIKNERG